MGIDRDPPACSHIQGDVTAERQPFVVGAVLKSCGLGRGHHGERDVYILSTVETENTYTPARWLALERACHRLHSPRFHERELHPLLLVAFKESLHELVEVRVAPGHCTGPVQPGTCGSRALSSR